MNSMWPLQHPHDHHIQQTVMCSHHTPELCYVHPKKKPYIKVQNKQQFTIQRVYSLLKPDVPNCISIENVWLY